MPGRPSTTSEIESPTGCTKQLISVAQIDTGGGIDAARGYEAVFLRVEEVGLTHGLVLVALDAGQCARYAAAHLADVAFVALGVFLEQHFAGKSLAARANPVALCILVRIPERFRRWCVPWS